MKTRILVSWALLCVLVGPAAATTSQSASSAIELDPAIECWYHDRFPQLDARLVPEQPVEQARLYFRCSLYPDYYFVDLETAAAGYRGAGPIADESCPRVHYYVETLTVDFTAARSEERVADVTSHEECRRRFPAAALFPGDPDLIIGSTVAGTPSMAPGFQLSGVKGFLSAATGQVATSGGSGISPAAAVGIGAAGAGAVAAVVVTSSSEGEAPSPSSPDEAVGSAPPPAPAPAPPATPSPSQSLLACFDVDPESATIAAGETVRLDGRCSTPAGLTYRWDLGDGRVRDGAFITPAYPNPGAFTVTLTVSDGAAGASFGFASNSVSKTIRVLAPPKALSACFAAVPLNLGPNCEMKFDATCSVGDIVSYDWILDQGNAMGAGPYPETGAVVVHNWSGYPGCVSFPPWTPISVLLTVTARDGSKASISLTVDVELLRATSVLGQAAAAETSFTSVLSADEGEGRIRHNDTALAASAGLVVHRARSRLGANEIEASLTAPLSSDATWRFDFRGAPGFVPGSIDVRSGDVVSSDAHSIVFRLRANALESLRLIYRLAR